MLTCSETGVSVDKSAIFPKVYCGSRLIAKFLLFTLVTVVSFTLVSCTRAVNTEDARSKSQIPSSEPAVSIPPSTTESQPLTTDSRKSFIRMEIGKPEDLILFDKFEYPVDRNDPDSASIFQQKGKWTSVKTRQSGGRGNGYLYTVNQIPGYSGTFPGGNSRRVLAMEALPGSLDGQTDFYLQYGDGESAAYDNAIPGNVWFQFWIYINYHGNQLSQLDGGNKFIYPCNATYPCGTGKWILSFGSDSYLPHYQSLGRSSKKGAYLVNIAQVHSKAAEITNKRFQEWDRWKLGQTNTSQYMKTNRWTLVKIHLDTSTTSGAYEVWMKPLGGAWTKTTEWISGVTPGFNWSIHSEHVGGHRVIRMPTTIGSGTPDRPRWDSWIYLDDFTIARSEAGLPVYR